MKTRTEMVVGALASLLLATVLIITAVNLLVALRITESLGVETPVELTSYASDGQSPGRAEYRVVNRWGCKSVVFVDVGFKNKLDHVFVEYASTSAGLVKARLESGRVEILGTGKMPDDATNWDFWRIRFYAVCDEAAMVSGSKRIAGPEAEGEPNNQGLEP